MIQFYNLWTTAELLLCLLCGDNIKQPSLREIFPDTGLLRLLRCILVTCWHCVSVLLGTASCFGERNDYVIKNDLVEWDFSMCSAHWF